MLGGFNIRRNTRRDPHRERQEPLEFTNDLFPRSNFDDPTPVLYGEYRVKGQRIHIGGEILLIEKFKEIEQNETTILYLGMSVYVPAK